MYLVMYTRAHTEVHTNYVCRLVSASMLWFRLVLTATIYKNIQVHAPSTRTQPPSIAGRDKPSFLRPHLARASAHGQQPSVSLHPSFPLPPNQCSFLIAVCGLGPCFSVSPGLTFIAQRRLRPIIAPLPWSPDRQQGVSCLWAELHVLLLSSITSGYPVGTGNSF